MAVQVIAVVVGDTMPLRNKRWQLRDEIRTPPLLLRIPPMSLESTTTIKSKLAAALGPKAPRYWSLLQSFLAATISRTEFDEHIRECVDTSPLGTKYSPINDAWTLITAHSSTP